MGALGVEGYHATTLDLTIGKFDIWSQRGLSVVWGRVALEHYDGWLFGFAESWLETVHRDALTRQTESRIDHRIEALLVDLRVRLVQRLEYWRAEARKYVSEQEAQSQKAANSDTALAWEGRAGPDSETIDFRTDLGRNLDRLRKECGWTFDQLSEESRIDKKTILRHVNKGGRAYPGTVKAYAKALSQGLGRSVTVAELETSPPRT